MKSKKKSAKKRTVAAINHRLGDTHFIEGVMCSVRIVNNGTAWVTPMVSDPETPLVAPHIAFAKVDSTGKITLI